MIQIVVPTEIAEQIRPANEQVDLVDAYGNRIRLVRRPPTNAEIQFAKSRMGSEGEKVTIDEVISKLESL